MTTKLKAGTAGLLALGLVGAPVAMFATVGCSGQVAATVNGENIEEQKITDYIQTYRENNGLTDDKTWAQYLVDSNKTAKDLRSEILDQFIEDKLIEQEAKKRNISVSDDDVSKQIEEIQKFYSLTDQSKFEAKLKELGYTPDSYREYVKKTLLSEKLLESVSEGVTASDSDVLSLANNYKATLNGAKQVKCIVFNATDADKAKTAAENIAKDPTTFDKEAEASITTDYDGWDINTNQDAAVSTAIADLQKGAVSGAIQGTSDTSKIFIVKVVDVLTVGDDGFASVNDIPADLRDLLTETATASTKKSNYSTYVDGLRTGGDIKINDMPEKLPYDVSTDGLTPTNTASTTTSSTSTTQVEVNNTTTANTNSQ